MILSQETLLAHLAIPHIPHSPPLHQPPLFCQLCPHPNSAATTPTPTLIEPEALNIKIIDAVLFAHILQDGTPTYQLQITPELSEKHLHAGTIPPEQKTEEQILHKVVPPEYHEFADMFSEGSTKELPPHCSYDYKIDLEESTSPPFGKIYSMYKIKLQALKDYLNDMLGKGFIHLLISPAGASLLFAKKKSRSL
ncbi:hypothetical protein E4T56_gene2292 [Termitomyces sp. T112]|nr:hypothetical protein E4T56_gene2292 [Termitomyces sp. T112]